MTRHIEVQDPAASVLNHEEAIEQLEGNRRYREDIEGGDPRDGCEEMPQLFAALPRRLIRRR